MNLSPFDLKMKRGKGLNSGPELCVGPTLCTILVLRSVPPHANQYIKHIDEHIVSKSVHIDSNTQAEQIDQGRDHSKMDYSNQIDDSLESAIEESDEKEETMGDERDDHSKGENII